MISLLFISLLLPAKNLDANYIPQMPTTSIMVPCMLWVGFLGFISCVSGKLLPTIFQRKQEWQHCIKYERKAVKNNVDIVLQTLAHQQRDTKKRNNLIKKKNKNTQQLLENLTQTVNHKTAKILQETTACFDTLSRDLNLYAMELIIKLDNEREEDRSLFTSELDIMKKNVMMWLNNNEKEALRVHNEMKEKIEKEQQKNKLDNDLIMQQQNLQLQKLENEVDRVKGLAPDINEGTSQNFSLLKNNMQQFAEEHELLRKKCEEVMQVALRIGNHLKSSNEQETLEIKVPGIKEYKDTNSGVSKFLLDNHAQKLLVVRLNN